MKYVLAILFYSFCSISASAQDDFCGIHNTAYKGGEKLQFRVFYNMSKLWVHAGDVNFSVRDEVLNNKPVYHVVGVGSTISSYEWFYKVRDRYETFIEKTTGLPLKFKRDVDEGGMKFTNDVLFDQSRKRAYSTKGVYVIPNCIQDVLSAIYYARSIDYSHLKSGDKIPFSMFLDDKVYNLFIRYRGKEKITTRYGTFNTIKISPLLIEGTLFKGGEEMTVWVSDDLNHVPVRIESPIVVGSIKVDMVGFAGLRNALSGLLNKS